MRFGRVLESYLQKPWTAHDPDVHAVTHEVLTGHGMARTVTMSGETLYGNSYDDAVPGYVDRVGPLHADLASLGWNHRDEYDKDEHYNDGGRPQHHHTRVYDHPNHMRELVVSQYQFTHDDYDDTPEGRPKTSLCANFGGYRRTGV